MAKVFIEETTLTAIGDAIRSKTGKTELIDPANMGTEIANIPAGGGGFPEEAYTLSGNLYGVFASNKFAWYIKALGPQITTKSVQNCQNMFETFTALKEIPFDINIASGYINVSSVCSNMCFQADLTKAPTINLPSNFELKKIGSGGLLRRARYLQNADNVFDADVLETLRQKSLATSTTWASCYETFSECMNLRSIPLWWYKIFPSASSTAYPSAYQTPYPSAFKECRRVKEIPNITVLRAEGATTGATSNLFSTTFDMTSSLRRLTFETDNGVPYVTKWKAQIIDLTQHVGYWNTAPAGPYQDSAFIQNKVTDDATYQAFRDSGSDWWTLDAAYAAYNHDSAVETINSLPDTSAYLASAGGTNTIKFKGAAGSATEGGAINTLTEEEIAVAAAKGWTVTFA